MPGTPKYLKSGNVSFILKKAYRLFLGRLAFLVNYGFEKNSKLNCINTL